MVIGDGLIADAIFPRPGGVKCQNRPDGFKCDSVSFTRGDCQLIQCSSAPDWASIYLRFKEEPGARKHGLRRDIEKCGWQMIFNPISEPSTTRIVVEVLILIYRPW